MHMMQPCPLIIKKSILHNNEKSPPPCLLCQEQLYIDLGINKKELFQLNIGDQDNDFQIRAMVPP